MAIDRSIQKTLHQWFLARLRKAAHEELAGQDSTPATLITVDRDLIRILTGQKPGRFDVEKRTVLLQRDGKAAHKVSFLIFALSVLGHIVITFCALH